MRKRSFLSRVLATEEEDGEDLIVHVYDIYREDPQYKKLVNSVADYLRKFSDKFDQSEDDTFKMFVTHLKREL